MRHELQQIEVNQLITELYNALKVSSEAMKKSEMIIQELQPKAEFYDLVIDTGDLFDLSQTAKILNYPNMGRNNLKKFMREQGMLIGNDTPHNYLIKQDYMTTKIKYIPALDKDIPVPLVTPKGLDYLRRKINEHIANTTH